MSWFELTLAFVLGCSCGYCMQRLAYDDAVKLYQELIARMHAEVERRGDQLAKRKRCACCNWER